MKYVIIGNSTAAIGTVEGIRKIDKDGPITIIGSEPHPAYSRPLISYLIQGKTDETRMLYRPETFYADNGCTLLSGRTVTHIDPKKKCVLLENGEAVAYDRLMVATGSRPFVPPAEGMDSVAARFTFQSLDDAQALRQALRPDARVLVVGGGLIGLKCAECLADKVGELHVVELSDHILSSILDTECAAMVQAEIEKHGVVFHLGKSVQRYEANRAHLSDGSDLEFDLLVTAVGVRANIALLSEIGGKVGRGILTDDGQQTSIPDIYAAGDCVESQDISCGLSRVLAILPNAYLQGECGGENMAGGAARFDTAIPMNSIGFFDFHMVSAGSPRGECRTIPCENGVRKFFVEDGRLAGYVLVGDVRRAGIYTSLVRNRTPLDETDFDMLMRDPLLMAFSKERRSQILGGVV